MDETITATFRTGPTDVRTGAPGQQIATTEIIGGGSNGFASSESFNQGLTVVDVHGDRVQRGSVDALENSDRIVWKGIPLTVDQYLNLGGNRQSTRPRRGVQQGQALCQPERCSCRRRRERRHQG